MVNSPDLIDLVSQARRRHCPSCGCVYDLSVSLCPVDGTDLEGVGPEALLGSCVGDKYRLEALIGQSDISVVYKAWHEFLEKTVAIKMLRPDFEVTRQMWMRFRQEAKAASALSCPYIINVYDFGMLDNGHPYLVMDYLEGSTLGQLIKAMHPLPPERCLTIAMQVCDALEHAHTAGIVHRDIKPNNIMITADKQGGEQVKLLDFGLAKLLSVIGRSAPIVTRSGEIVGTPCYMSPEQIMSGPINERSDIYSFGCVLFEMFTGCLPFAGTSAAEVLQQHLRQEPPSLAEYRRDIKGVEELSLIVSKAMQKEPEKRYTSASELREALRQWCQARGKFLGLPWPKL